MAVAYGTLSEHANSRKGHDAESFASLALIDTQCTQKSKKEKEKFALLGLLRVARRLGAHAYRQHNENNTLTWAIFTRICSGTDSYEDSFLLAVSQPTHLRSHAGSSPPHWNNGGSRGILWA